MAGKKKISKKELLKKPDEFITFSNRAYNWITTHSRPVIVGLSAAVLLAVLYFGYSTHQNRQEKQSRAQYFSALEIGDPGQQLTKLEGIIQKYPRTQGAHLARVSAGHLCFQKKDFQRAVSFYQAALDKGKFPPDIRALILENLAYAYEQKGDLKQAASTFQQITQGQEEQIKEEALLNLARVYLKMGDKNQAKAAYQRFIARYPKSAFVPIVKDKLARW